MSAEHAGGAVREVRRVLVAGAVLGQPLGGVRRHNRELLPRLARALAARGGELAVLEGTRPAAFDLPREVRRIASRVPAAPAWLRGVRETPALRRELDRARAAGRPYDLVHTAHLPAPRGLPVPMALLVHDLKFLDRSAAPLSRRMLSRGFLARATARAAAVLAVSQALEGELRHELSVDPERLFVVRNGGDHLAILARAEAPAGLLYVGHLEPRKNVALLLQALARDPELPDLELVGAARGREGEHLAALAARLGVAARVSFLGERGDADLARHYARTACLVLPSRREGFGIPVLEARRAGAPVCVADLPALREVAGDAPSFDPGDAEGCVRALRSALARTPAELESSREQVLPWTWDAAAASCLAAWDAAVSRRR